MEAWVIQNGIRSERTLESLSPEELWAFTVVFAEQSPWGTSKYDWDAEEWVKKD